MSEVLNMLFMLVVIQNCIADSGFLSLRSHILFALGLYNFFRQEALEAQAVPA